ncbi:MAG: DNA starvation/stationary phase protection protein [Deltaproteobacteria bacterium]|nr:DNA starvation/stationary phase protection protein [Sandaracinaceae bacterium]MCX7808397.1 DNA starvation/stationary phase protection protein [Deltaproteobacteria bacterium]MDW8245582.1 Dps family protein [Sandaracinaceae bacterium]
MTNQAINIGIDESKRQAIAEGLVRILATTYALYFKTHSYHWNVRGPLFASLHSLFETQYTELAQAVDELAERVRSLGVLAPSSWKALWALSSIPDDDEVPDAMEMVRRLAKGHEAIAKMARELFSVAEDSNDQASADLLTARMKAHEKAAWMLRSTAE